MRTLDKAQQAANFALLGACTGPHEFLPIYEAGDPKPVGGECRVCGGTLSRSSLNWYLRGLKAGAAFPEAVPAILPGWLK